MAKNKKFYLEKRKKKHERKKTRKTKKHERKNKQKQQYSDWLTPDQNKQLRKISDRFTREEFNRVQNLPRHTRFFCDKCLKTYCLNQNGEVMYCKSTCKPNQKPENYREQKGVTWVGCSNTEVKDIRTCENCQ